MRDKSITKMTFQKLFMPLEMDAKSIHYDFTVHSKNYIYSVRYNRRKGNIFGSKGKGWMVSKYKELGWTSFKPTKEERETVIEFCKNHMELDK